VSLLFNIHCVGTGLSLIGTIWTIYFCLKVGVRKYVSYKLIFAITLSDFFYAISNLLASFAGPSLNILCHIDAFIRVCSFTLSLFFATCLSLLCLFTVKYGSKFNEDSFFKKCLILAVIMCIWLTTA